MVPEPLKQPRAPDLPHVPGYRIEEVLGRGATGTVYRARQLAVDREVALKVLHPELSGQQRIVSRLQREARTTARLAHPNIVTAIDMGEIDGRWWYAMEYVEGPSLSLRLRQEGRLKEREALRLFIPLCEALEHLWEHGVVHRDIKPGNILIDRGGRARLADLGLAFADDDLELTGQGGTLGTPHYISPEQAIDPTSADVRSDIWSFGATLYHAVCGLTPFRGESAAEILSGVLYGRIPDPLELAPSLSKGLALVLRKCLTREPQGRYQTPRELLLDLERVRERRPPNVRRRALDPVQRHGRPWALPAALGLVLVAAPLAAWAWFQRDDAPAEGPGAVVAAPQPFEPLEGVARRYAERPQALATHLHELGALRAGLPAEHLERWSELMGILRADLRRRVEALQAEAEAEVAAELERRDYAAAWATLEAEIGPRLLRETGFRLDDLAAEGVFVEPWADRLGLEVTTQTAAAVEELRADAERWIGALVTEVDELRAERRWRSARARIPSDDAGLLAAAGSAEVRLRREQLEEALLEARSEVRMLRLHVEDDWREADRQLRQWADERARTLEAELQAREVREGADQELLETFERELRRRRVQPEETLPDVANTAAELVQRRAEDLARLEGRLLEVELVALFEDSEREAEIFARKREYEYVGVIWEDARAALEEAGPASEGWRAGLRERAELRAREARLLQELLYRVSDRIRALAGQRIDLWVGSILQRDAVVVPGADPLADGFRIESWPEPLNVRKLRSTDLEALAGLGVDESTLVPEDRLLLALFRFNDGRAEEARRALLSGPLPERAPAVDLVDDLNDRVLEAIERQAESRKEREERVGDLLLRTLDEGSGERSPDTVLRRIKVLLEDYGDVAPVRERRQELLDLRDRLVRSRGAGSEEELRRAYRPAELELPRPSRARLRYAFDGHDAGAWDRGEWRFDGRGWSLPRGTPSWPDLLEQRGPRLALREPLDLGTGNFVASFTIEQPDEPPALLLLSVAGFHIAFSGPGLPGGDGEARWLVGMGTADELVQRVRRGEGTLDPELLARGGRHTIELVAYRGSGRLDLQLDGRALRGFSPTAPTSSELAVLVRSWEPVRLVAFELEANH